MNLEYRRKLEKLLRHKGLSKWERNAFNDMLKKPHIKLSFKQRELIDRKFAEYFKGVKRDAYECIWPLEYHNCEAVYVPDKGYKIVDNNGVQYGPYLVKKEVWIILAWFTEALEGLEKAGLSTKPLKKKQDKKPF